MLEFADIGDFVRRESGGFEFGDPGLPGNSFSRSEGISGEQVDLNPAALQFSNRCGSSWLQFVGDPDDRQQTIFTCKIDDGLCVLFPVGSFCGEFIRDEDAFGPQQPGIADPIAGVPDLRPDTGTG